MSQLTDNEIVRFLNRHTCNNSATVMRVFSEDGKEKDIVITFGNVRDLINRQQAENERLKYQVNRLKNYDERRDIALHSRLIANARAEAIKEFAEKVKDLFVPEDEVRSEIDNLVKEMVSEN